MESRMRPSPLPSIPSQINNKGRIAMAEVKIVVVWTVRLSAGIELPATSTDKTTTMVKLMTLPPTTSPKESSGIPERAELIPTKRLGSEDAKAITKKATTNSRHCRDLAMRIKELIKEFPAQNKTRDEKIKMQI